MTRQEAQSILLRYRLGDEVHDLEAAQALEVIRQDAELQRWFERHLASQSELRSRLREIPVPSGLKEQILDAQRKNKIIRPTHLWRQPAWLAAAACFVILLGLGVYLFQPRRPDRFSDYRARMVETALRGYGMDVNTPDMSKLRQYFSSKGAPAEYPVGKALERTPLTGGCVLTWRSNPVSMACFDRGNKRMVFLFVIQRKAARGAPLETPEMVRENKLQTISWSVGDKTFLLAGEEGAEKIRDYLP